MEMRPHSSPRPAAPAPPTAVDETVLVVDDDPHVRGSIRSILLELGYRVVEAAAPDEALRQARATPVDLLLVDVILPMMSGLVLAKAFLALRPDTRILFMSGYTDEGLLDEVRAGDPGVAFLAKPFTTTTLTKGVRSLLDRPISSPRADSGTTPRGHETVLVVDDDAELCRNVAHVLERLGYRVLQARDPDHALRLALESAVALIVMDVVLPGLNGVALADTLAQVRPETRILFMSALDREALAEEHGLDPQGTGFLEKPFTPDEIGRKVRSMIDEAREEPGTRRIQGR